MNRLSQTEPAIFSYLSFSVAFNVRFSSISQGHELYRSTDGMTQSKLAHTVVEHSLFTSKVSLANDKVI
jgi:hypothetical protein